jgi:hypothetical protein
MILNNNELKKQVAPSNDAFNNLFKGKFVEVMEVARHVAVEYDHVAFV